MLKCVSWMQQKDGSWFYIHSVRDLFMGAFRPSLMTEISEWYLLVPVILLVVVMVVYVCVTSLDLLV